MAYGSGKTWTKGLWIGVDPGSNPPGVVIMKHLAKNVTITPEDEFIEFPQDNHLLTQDIEKDAFNLDNCICWNCGKYDKEVDASSCPMRITCGYKFGGVFCEHCELRNCQYYTNCVVYDGLG